MCLSQKSISMTKGMSFSCNQPEADDPPQLQSIGGGTLYWHIDCQAEHEVCVELGSEVRRLIDAIQALPNDAV